MCATLDHQCLMSALNQLSNKTQQPSTSEKLGNITKFMQTELRNDSQVIHWTSPRYTLDMFEVRKIF